jgi:broad specificity phosphatase PhoE
MTEIYLVRHGQTDWNLEKRIQGNADIPLNDEGITQSQALAESLQGERFDAVFSSDLIRAAQTAQILARRLSAPLFYDPRLREVNHGKWEGMLISDVRSQYSGEYSAFRDDRPDGRAPGGETMREALQRIEAAVDEAARQYPGGRIVIVSHGLALALLRCRLNNAPLNLSHLFGLDNCAGELIHWKTRQSANLPSEQNSI